MFSGWKMRQIVDWNKLADESSVEKTVMALKERGIETIIVDKGDDAKKKLLGMIPKRSEVMEGSSTTLDQIGVTKELEESGNYVALRKTLYSIDDPNKRAEARRKASTPEYGIGSVHAITEDGQLVTASASGSQLATYVYGAANLILVAGTQKIVKNLDDAFKRIYEHALPLESERVRKAYGWPGSSVSKILIIEKEKPGRIKLILVKEKLGF